jgi:hypothetical protein
VVQITRGVGAKIDGTATLMVVRLKHIFNRLHSQNGALVSASEVSDAVTELEELEAESRLEALGLVTQRWQAFVAATLWATLAQVLLAAYGAGLAVLPEPDCYDASDNGKRNNYMSAALTFCFVPPAALNFVIAIYHVSIPNTRYGVLVDCVKVEGERTMRSVRDWHERFGPKCVSLIIILICGARYRLYPLLYSPMKLYWRQLARVLLTNTAPVPATTAPSGHHPSQPRKSAGDTS